MIYYRYYFGKKNNISIAITSSINYFEKTIPLLIDDLTKNGVELNDIYVFVGGYDKNEKVECEFNLYRVQHNSFDLTALISIVELKIDKVDHWLLLHDTIRLNNVFFYIYKGLNPKNFDCLPLRKCPSMNIGLYSMDFLKKNTDYLFEIKNTDYSIEGIQKSKYRAVLEEDYLFKNTENKRYINKYLIYKEEKKQELYFGNMRKKETYPQLGIIKYKANYELKTNWIIDL